MSFKYPLFRNSRAINWLMVIALAVTLVLPPPGVRKAVDSLPGLAVHRPNLSFIPNIGHTGSNIQFQAVDQRGDLRFTAQGVILSIPRTAGQTGRHGELAEPREFFAIQASSLGQPDLVSIQFVGANPDLQIVGTDRKAGTVNYLIGQDRSGWRTGLPSFAGIVYPGIYPDIDLHYGGSSGRLKGTFEVKPGADPTQIRWRYAGALNPQVAIKTGDLEIPLKGSRRITERAPIAWQTFNGERVPVEVSYIVHADGSAGFAVGPYDRTRILTIDPTLDYSTYLGGDKSDLGYAIALDGLGYIYISGESNSTDFPGPDGETVDAGSDSDAFVTKLTPDGQTIVFTTFIGGSSRDLSWDLAVDPNGYVTVLGRTDSLDFPTVNPAQPEHGGGVEDAFVSKLMPDGAGLVYSTYLGGNGADRRFGIVLDTAGNSYFTGWTDSTDFPTLNARQPTYGGGEKDGFVVKLSSTGALLYSTYLGGDNVDVGAAIAIDQAGNAYITGYTNSSNFPLVGAFQTTLGGGGGDLFLSKLNTDGSQLVYSTFIGGTKYENSYGVIVDHMGSAYVTGKTDSLDFPLVSPVQPVHGGSSDVFILKMAADGSRLDFSSVVGGTGIDKGYGIALDKDNDIYVVGWVESIDFPTVDPVQSACAGDHCEDTLVLKLKADGSQLLFSTYLGGTGEDYDGREVAVDEADNPIVVGWTESVDFPTVNPLQDNNAGVIDTFIVRYSGIAEPVEPLIPVFLPVMLR